MARQQNSKAPRARLTHVDSRGQARMVDVGAKPVTRRIARARGEVRLQPRTLQLIRSGDIAKGDVFPVARVAAITAAKRTADLIPLCHPLPIEVARVELTPREPDRIEIEAEVRVTGKTGVEMEALTAVAVAGLAIYDMCKAVDRSITIGDIRLIEKRGGRSGRYRRRE